LGESQAAAELLAAGTATTLLGDDVNIRIDSTGNVFINDSQVIVADIPAENGIVHVIDAVLLP
ncbi:MAG: fasciclin domain-containing protein, partial [Actinomycetota bacterium]